MPRIEERQLHALYYEVELPLCRVLAEMELAGVRVDAKALADFGAAMDAELKTLEERIYEEADGQLQHQLPQAAGRGAFRPISACRTAKKTKTGWSTNADVLEKLRWEHPIVAGRAAVPQYAKLKSTYCDGPAEGHRPGRARAHAASSMTVTATGRLSSTEPNLQNIPTRTRAGQRAAADVRAPSAAMCSWTRTTARSSCGCSPTYAGDETMTAGLSSRRGYPHRHRLAGVRRADGGGDAADALAAPRRSTSASSTASRPFRSRRTSA